MHSQIRLSETVQDLLCCPICKAELELHSNQYQCKNLECNTIFPIIDGIPILIDEDHSIFSIDDFVNSRKTTFYLSQTKFEQAIQPFLPNISRNIKSKENYDKFARLLLEQSDTPKVLVIGASIVGSGMESITKYSQIELIESDVTFGPCTAIISDAHNIPFKDISFDAVIVQAVLEHVVDPWRCVEEIHRVLKDDGLIYAETPFMQQVHGGRYDFTRFTHLGHRRLFRKFEEIDSGAVCGPGMALAWSYKYLLLSFTTSRFLRRLIGVFARLTAFFLPYIDYFLIDKPGTLDAASGYYFLGRRSNQVLPDRDLIKLYKGVNLT